VKDVLIKPAMQQINLELQYKGVGGIGYEFEA
jgi:hypothetical protein